MGAADQKRLVADVLADLEREILGPSNPNPHRVRELLAQLRTWTDLVDEKVRKPK